MARLSLMELDADRMKSRILILEEDQSVRVSLTKLLTLKDFDVLQAEDQLEAIRLFKGNPVDLVILDVQIREDGGWATFERLKELNPSVPGIAITAEFDQWKHAVKAGVEALIEKPLDVPVFLGFVQDLLIESRKRMERPSRDEKRCRYVPAYRQSPLGKGGHLRFPSARCHDELHLQLPAVE